MTEEDFAFYIPSMQSFNDLQSVTNAFEPYGKVSHVDFIQIVYPYPSRDFCRAVVFFSEWNNQSIVDAINHEGKFIFHLEDKKNYWILKKHRAPTFTPSSPSTTISSKSSSSMSLDAISLDEAHFPKLPLKRNVINDVENEEKEETKEETKEEVINQVNDLSIEVINEVKKEEVKKEAINEVKKEAKEEVINEVKKEVNEEVKDAVINDEVINDEVIIDEVINEMKEDANGDIDEQANVEPVTPTVVLQYPPISNLTPISPLPFYQHHDSIREIERLNQEVSRLKVELQSTIHFYQGQMEYISGFYQSRMNHLAEERSSECANLWRILKGVIEDEN